MKLFRIVLLSVLLLSTFISAQVKDMPEMKSKLQEMDNQFAEDMMAGDNSKMLEMYADDAISLPSYSPMMKGRENIKKAMEMDANSGNKMTDFKITTTDVFGSGDMIVEIGTYKLTMEMKGMDSPIDDHGKFMTVYEKQDDGSLKIKADTWNSDMNPWMNNGDMDDTMKQDDKN